MTTMRRDHPPRRGTGQPKSARVPQVAVYDLIRPLMPHTRLPTVQSLDPAVALRGVPGMYLSYPAFCDTMHIIAAAGPYEIGWLGSVRELGNDNFLIERVFLIRQDVHLFECVLDGEAIGRFQYQLVRRGPAGKRLARSLRFWGHLHPLDTVPSLLDEQQMDFFRSNWPWFIRGIFTRFGDASCTFFDYARRVKVTDLPLWLAVADHGRRKVIHDQVRRLVRAGTMAQRRKEGSDGQAAGSAAGEPAAAEARADRVPVP